MQTIRCLAGVDGKSCKRTIRCMPVSVQLFVCIPEVGSRRRRSDLYALAVNQSRPSAREHRRGMYPNGKFNGGGAVFPIKLWILGAGAVLCALGVVVVVVESAALALAGWSSVGWVPPGGALRIIGEGEGPAAASSSGRRNIPDWMG